MNQDDQQLKKSMDEASKTNTVIVLKPEDAEEMIKKNIGVKKTFTPYSEYIMKLYQERIELGFKLLHKLPQLDEKTGSAVVTQIYGEVRESLAFGFPSSAILNSMLLLEYALRLRLFNKFQENDKTFEWRRMEQMNFKALISRLRGQGIFDKNELKELGEFNEDYRNTYLHMNIAKMAYGQTIPVDRINIKSGKKEKIDNMKLEESPFLWFAAKVKFDRDHVFEIIDFCVGWTNKLLVRK